MTNLSTKNTFSYLLFFVLYFLSFAVYAQSGAGGLATATSMATTIKTGLFTFAGVVALIYLIYVGVMCMAEKKQWSDFGMAVIYVAVLGGALSLGEWAWGLFSGS